MEATTRASVPFMITNPMKDALHARGITDEEIVQLLPERAHEILSTPDQREVREFIETYVAQARAATAEIEKPGLLNMVLVNPADDDVTSVYRYAIDDPSLTERMISDAINASAAGHNAYCEGRTVRPGLNGKQRGGLTDTVAVFALVVDSDRDKSKAWTPTVPTSLAVETSPNNAHYWFFFDKALDPATAQVLGERLRAATNADSDTGNVCQPYRIAGTTNYPNKKKLERGRIVTWTRSLGFDPETLWTPERFEQEFPVASKPTGGGTTNAGDATLDEVDIPADTLDAIKDTSEGQRGTRFWNIMIVLKARGFTIDGIVALFEKYPDGVAAKYRGRLRHQVETVWAKLKEEQPESKTPLPFINMSNWDNEPVPEQEWSVLNRIPRRQTALFSGEGAAGKSTIQLHLSAAHVLGKDWLGSLPEQGPVIFLDAEDDEKALHRRLAAITRHYNVKFADLIAGGLHILSLAGEDAVLATANRGGKIVPTPFYKQLFEAAGDIKPVSIGIASCANVYAGSELDRGQVQQFIGLLTRLSIVANGSTTLITHPSLTGINSESGMSGSTQWHNAVRARFYLKGIKPDAGEEPDGDLREIVFKKNQYGPTSDSITLRYTNGMFLPVPGLNIDRAAREAKADDVFLALLQRFEREGRNVTDESGQYNAPRLFALEPDALTTRLKKDELSAAMRRLLAQNRIHREQYRKKSEYRWRLAFGPKPDAAIIPFPGPPPRAKPKSAPPRAKPKAGGNPVAEVFAAWANVLGFNSKITVALLLKSIDHGIELNPERPDTFARLKQALLVVAANGAGTIDGPKLEQWLASVADTEVNQMTMQRAGVDEDGASLWSLMLLVKPDPGRL